jgi:diguanylate cyclase (GGDEF)-like protein
MQAQVPALLSEAAVANSRVALLYIDLDNFKDINDTRGHGCGDALLKGVAARLQRAVQFDDAVYRMGGDEFIVVTGHAASRPQVESLAESLRETLALPLDIDGRETGVSASIGIGIYPDDGVDVESLLKHADVALYQAKNQGRNEYRFYFAGQSQAIAERIELESALTRAIELQELFLEYQPLINIETGAVVGLEALARWQHPQRGLVPPVTFVGVAERCGLIDSLGELLLRQLCRQLHAWQRELLAVLPVAINVSPRQFDHGRFVRSFEAITQEYGVDPSCIEVEVTESALMSRGDGHHEALEALQGHGVRIAIDDFGTGYSSLSYLKHLPVAGVKIDRTFVRDMLCDPRDAAIVTAVINIGHSLGLRVVAEGVETLSQLQRLQVLGCDVAQGYYHYRPLTAAQAGELIAAEARRPLPDRSLPAAGRLRPSLPLSAASPLRRLP